MLCLLSLVLIVNANAWAKESETTLSNNILIEEARRLKNMGESMQNRIEKPLQFGNNVELSFDFDWQSNILVDTKLKIMRDKRSYILEYAELKEKGEGENYDYETTGYGTKFQINNPINEQFKVNLGVIRVKNDYAEADRSNQYTILRAENIAQINSKNKLKLITDYAIAGENTAQDFQKMRVDWQWKKQLAADERFTSDFQIGIASSETPIAYRFKLGGFNGLKLRGQDDTRAGDICVVNSFKYQRKLIGENKFKFLALEKILGSAFLDVGKVTTRDEFFHRGLEMDFGLGLKTKLKLGDIKAGLAVDDIDSSPQFHLKFKEDF